MDDPADRDPADDEGPFPAELVAAVAAEFDVDSDRLRELAAATQSLAEAVRSVDGLVFEYRDAFGDVVAARTESTYYLRVPPHVWTEFGERLDASEGELAALGALHARRFEEAVERSAATRESDRQPMVLERR